MSLIDHVLNQDGKIINTTTNKHGDQKVTTQVPIKLRFRYITNIDRNVNREGINSDAIVWLSPDTAAQEGTILFTEEKYWRIVTLIKARRLSGSQVEFVKAFVNQHSL